MKQPETIAEIFRVTTGNFPQPITGKIRLGWDEDALNYLEVAQVIQESGGAMLAVHGRTRKQAYRGQARWEPIREIKAALTIPVIGNGDVRTVADIEHIQQLSGCDAVMIGRAAIGNPWLFQRLDRHEVPAQMVHETILEHLNAMVSFYGGSGVITFRKFLKAYLSEYDLSRETLLMLLAINTTQNLIDGIGEVFDAYIYPVQSLR